MKIKISIIIISVLFCFSDCKKELSENNQSAVLKVHTFIGKIKVINGNQIESISLGFIIPEKSIIKVGALSLIDIKYGNLGIIRINQNSEVKVARLMESLNKVDTMLEMKKGSLFITVSKLKKESDLKIKTPTAIAAIRGTTFKILAKGKKSRVDVLAGKVKVNPVRNGQVIENVEQVVEKNKRIELDEKVIETIIDKDGKIAVVDLKKEDIAEIKKKAGLIKIDNSINSEVVNEINEIGIKSKTESEIKDNNEYQNELIENIKNIKEEQKDDNSDIKKAEEKDTEKLKNTKAAQTRKAALEEKKRLETKKAAEEKLKKEQLEKERLARQQEEIKKKKAAEEKKKEKRVKNIPTF